MKGSFTLDFTSDYQIVNYIDPNGSGPSRFRVNPLLETNLFSISPV